MASTSDWRNVRVKEEPLSDFEGDRRDRSSSSSRPYQDRRSQSQGQGHHGRRDRDRDRSRSRSPPPPPSSRHRSSGSRRPSRSRSRSRSGSRERDSHNRRRRERSRSRDRERFVQPQPPVRVKQEREREVKQERDRGDRRSDSSRERDRDRPPPPEHSRRIKSEPRSRSRSPGSQQRPPRDPARERDWDSFFNPTSALSLAATKSKAASEKHRQDILSDQYGPPKSTSGSSEDPPPEEKQQPNFGLSGKLTEETNTFRGVVIKYAEPPEARKPNKIRWRLYPFKGEEPLPVMYVHRQSAYLLGRDRKVADIPVDHPSCSKQHAVLQYRLVPYVRADGSKGRRIRPYVIDLESANGTFVNGKQIEAKRYVELFEKDVLKFGFSSREYVLLHDESKDLEDDDYLEMTPD